MRIVSGNRVQAIAWAKNVVSDPVAAFLDTETTDKRPEDADIVDLAVVDLAGQVLINTLVRPPRPIPLDAQQIHGIADADVAAAPTWLEVWPGVEPILRGRRLVIYNANYDIAVIESNCRSAGIVEAWFGLSARRLINVSADCAMRQFAAFREIASPRGGWRWHRLGEAAAHFGVTVDGAHRALADAETCRRVVLAMAAAEVRDGR